MKDKFYYLFVLIVLVLAIILASLGKIGLGEIITLVILIVTALAVGTQAFATRKIAEYQFMPAVDVNMIYEKEARRTYFWFSNTSNIPAFVSFKVFLKDGAKNPIANQSLRIPPQQKRRTSIVYFGDFSPSASDEVTLNVGIKSAYKNFGTEIEFTKSYRFHPDLHRWDESSWGYPDPSWPDKIE